MTTEIGQKNSKESPKKISIISNPGSNSRKYSIFLGETEIANIVFDPNSGNPKCTVTDSTGQQRHFYGAFRDLNESGKVLGIIMNEIDMHFCVDIILVRIVATGDYFAKDRIVDDECIEMLEQEGPRSPLHAPVTLNEIRVLKSTFPGVKIALISDSAFHTERPKLSKYYAFSTDLADRLQIKRYGAHGISNESIVYQLREAGKLPENLVVCHIGSGASVTAIKNGKSFKTTMGYTPLEGVMMATRCGDIDPSAVLALKRAMHFSDRKIELFLNQQCGLFGVGGSNDFRDISRDRDVSEKANFAYDMFIDRIQEKIGTMAVSLGGIDAIVLTASISEYDATFRREVTKKLGFLGFEIDTEKNCAYKRSDGVFDISKTGSKPIYVIKTDETAIMARHAKNF